MSARSIRPDPDLSRRRTHRRLPCTDADALRFPGRGSGRKSQWTRTPRQTREQGKRAESVPRSAVSVPAAYRGWCLTCGNGIVCRPHSSTPAGLADNTADNRRIAAGYRCRSLSNGRYRPSPGSNRRPPTPKQADDPHRPPPRCRRDQSSWGRRCLPGDRSSCLRVSPSHARALRARGRSRTRLPPPWCGTRRLDRTEPCAPHRSLSVDADAGLGPIQRRDDLPVPYSDPLTSGWLNEPRRGRDCPLVSPARWRLRCGVPGIGRSPRPSQGNARACTQSLAGAEPSREARARRGTTHVAPSGCSATIRPARAPAGRPCATRHGAQLGPPVTRRLSDRGQAWRRRARWCPGHTRCRG